MNKTIVLLITLIILTPSIIIVKPVSTELVENSWETKASLPTPRACVGAAVVKGKIYVIGGMPDYDTNEEYDPATNTWTTKAPMPTGRCNFGITVYENKIYCIGGQFSHEQNPYAGSEFTGTVEVYDPATDEWKTKNPMPAPRCQLQASVVNGKIYLIGGRSRDQNSTVSSTVSLNEVYDPKTDTWTTKTPMPYPVTFYSSAVVGNKIYLFGGLDESNDRTHPTQMSVNQIYNADTDTWSLGAPLLNAVLKGAAAATSGVFAPQRIYVVGGEVRYPVEQQASNIVQIYDPKNDSWSYGASMLSRRIYLGLAVVDDRLYAIGGANGYILPGWTGSAENAMYTPFEHLESIDGTRPVVTILSPENRTYNSSNVALVFVVNELASWMGYSLDKEERVNVTSNTTLSGLSNGVHNVTMYANDTFGNMGISETSSFTVETQQELFPTLLVIAVSVAVIAVAVGLIVYFRKRKH